MQGQQCTQEEQQHNKGLTLSHGGPNGSFYHLLLAGIAGSFIPRLQAKKRFFLKANSPQENLLAQSYCHNWWRSHQTPQLAFPTIELLRGGRYNRQIKEHPLQNITGWGEEAGFQLQVTGITLFLFPFGPAGITKLYLLPVPYTAFHPRIPKHFKSKPMDSGIASLRLN